MIYHFIVIQVYKYLSIIGIIYIGTYIPIYLGGINGK